MIGRLVTFQKRTKDETGKFINIETEGRIVEEYVDEKITDGIKTSNKMVIIAEDGGYLNQCRLYQVLRFLE